MKKVLIIGLGNIGLYDDIKKKNIYTSHAKSLSKSTFFKVVGCVDTIKKRALKANDLYNFKVFKNIKEALKESSPDLIVISLKTKLHYLTIKEIFKYKNQIDIFCEKPGGQNLADALKIQNICRKNKSKCFVNYQRRSLKSSLKIKKIINDNKKDYCKGSVIYTSGIKNSASHYINLFQFLFGKVKKIKNIDCKPNKKLNDFNGDFLLYFKDATIYFIYSNKHPFNYAYYTLNFNKFKINYPNGKKYIEVVKKINSNFFNKKLLIDSKIKKIDLDIKNYQLNVYSQIENYFKGKHYELCDIGTSLKTMKVIENIRVIKN